MHRGWWDFTSTWAELGARTFAWCIASRAVQYPDFPCSGARARSRWHFHWSRYAPPPRHSTSHRLATASRIASPQHIASLAWLPPQTARAGDVGCLFVSETCQTPLVKGCRSGNAKEVRKPPAGVPGYGTHHVVIFRHCWHAPHCRMLKSKQLTGRGDMTPPHGPPT
jgi:hypothetical protein